MTPLMNVMWIILQNVVFVCGVVCVSFQSDRPRNHIYIAGWTISKGCSITDTWRMAFYWLWPVNNHSEQPRNYPDLLLCRGLLRKFWFCTIFQSVLCLTFQDFYMDSKKWFLEAKSTVDVTLFEYDPVSLKEASIASGYGCTFQIHTK